MDISPFFKLMVEQGASDLFFSVGAPPNIKVDGNTVAVGQAPLKSNQMHEIANSVMIDYRNENQRGYILTIKDPIEYLYRHKKSIVDQREMGIDTLNYENALKNALCEAAR